MNTIIKTALAVSLFSVLFLLPSCKKTVMGCMDVVACNYSDEVTEDNGSCTYAEENMDCGGSCVNDVDADGVCDESEIPGCSDANAYNYNAAATDDDGSCAFAANIMANTWNVSSDCEGIVGGLLPAEITIAEGDDEGGLMLDLGAGVAVNGAVDVSGNILIPSQEITLAGFTVTVNGNGQLDAIDAATIYINFASLLVNDNCVLTLTQ